MIAVVIALFRFSILCSRFRSYDVTKKSFFFSKLGISMLTRSLFDQEDKSSNLLSIVTWSILVKKIDMRDRSIIWRCYEDVRLENVHISKGISTPSLLKYMDMATLKFSLLTLLWRKSFLDFKCKSKIGVRLTRMLIYIFSHWTCPFEPK